MKAHIIVSLKPDVLDPQGDAVRRALESLGFRDARSVRIGKFIEIEIDGTDTTDIQARLASMSNKLLCNPVIENFRVEIPKPGK
ncbi:MAG: phosphoribosylformylglycinamidine synthase subunit PurS [Myxococcales bacterium]|nr:phosphoribosylformylglycinamidine synthase subunit PurS [Myxococcales bacterium]MCB9708989.1 phosphoribosylformylglycinamidine synthase subunit PurS [Myxococcales bacterium]